MRKYFSIAGIFLLFLGMAGMIYSVIAGDARVYVLIVIPIIAIRGFVGVLSVILLITGFLITAISIFGKYTSFEEDTRKPKNRRDGQYKKVDSSWGGVIFLGPFPIVFGSSGWKERIPSWIYLFILGIMAFIIAQIILFIFIITL